MSSNGPPLRKMNEMLLSVALPTDKMEDKALQLILKAPKEAVNLSSSSGSSQLGTVGDAVAAAKSTALVSKEIQEVIKISFRDALGSMSSKSSDGDIDDVMKVKYDLFTHFHYCICPLVCVNTLGCSLLLSSRHSCSSSC